MKILLGFHSMFSQINKTTKDHTAAAVVLTRSIMNKRHTCKKSASNEALNIFFFSYVPLYVILCFVEQSDILLSACNNKKILLFLLLFMLTNRDHIM